METAAPYTPTLTPVTPPAAFTPIKQLFHNSWNRVQKHLLQLFLLTVILFAVGIVFLIISGVVLFLTGFFSPVTAGSPFSSLAGVAAIVLFVILFLIVTVGMMLLQVASILLLAETQSGGATTLQLYKMALHKIGPLLVVSLLSGFIVIGGLVVLIIPGILFGILLSLASYFVLLDNLTPIEAMKKSVFVVSKNFGAIFTRMAALFLVSFVVGILFNMLSSQQGSLAFLTGFGSLIFNLLYGWISLAFMIFLYQDAKKVAGEGRGKISWMLGIALLGWIILIIGGYFIFQAIPSRTNPQPLLLNNSPLVLPNLATPTASLKPASPSSSIKPTTTPRPTATPKASATPKAATSSANR